VSAPVSTFTPTQVDDCVREPHAPAALLLQHVGQGVHGPTSHRYVLQSGDAGHGAKLGLLAALVMAGQPLPHRPLSTVLPVFVLHVHCVARESVG